MAGTEYTYKLVLESKAALNAAIEFKDELQKQLAKVPIKVKVDVSGVEGQMRGATRAATTAQQKGMAAFQREWKTTLGMYEKHFGQVAPKATMQALQGYFRETVDEPAQGAINRLRGVQDQIERTTHSITRMGVSVEDWMGAGQFERMGMAMQAAQRRWWGVRGFGYQVSGYGRGMMMAGGAALGGAALAAKEYTEYAEPLGRAARNLELNAQMAELLDEKLISAAGTMSMFTAEEQAQQLYLWAAATGEVVQSEEELNSTLARTREVQKLAALGMVDQGQAVEAVTDIMSQYQLNVADTEKIVATLIKVAAVSKAEVSDLTMAFRYAGVGAETANTSFEETAAALQILSGFGLRGSRAGRGLARLFENMIAPSGEAKKAFDELFQSVYGRTDVLINAEGQFVGLAEAIEILAEATENMTEAERAAFVARTTTQNASRVLLPLLQMELEGRKRNIDVIQAQTQLNDGLASSHTAAYTQMVEEVFGYEVSQKSAMNTLKDQWNDYVNSTAGRVRSMKSEFDAAMLSIGKAVMQEAIEPLEKLADLVNWLGDMARQYPEEVGAVARTAAKIAAVGALTVAVGKLITLYADVKSFLTAKEMYATAMTQMSAAEVMQIAATEMMAAAGVMQTIPAQMAAAAAGGAAAGGGGTIFLPGGRRHTVPAPGAPAGAPGVPTGGGGGTPVPVPAGGRGSFLGGVLGFLAKNFWLIMVFERLNSLANAQTKVMEAGHDQMTELRRLTGDWLNEIQRQALFGQPIPGNRMGTRTGGPYQQDPRTGMIYSVETGQPVSAEELRQYLDELGLLEKRWGEVSQATQDGLRAFREAEREIDAQSEAAKIGQAALMGQARAAAYNAAAQQRAADAAQAHKIEQWVLHASVNRSREGIQNQVRELVALGEELGYDTSQLALFNQEMENLYWLTQQDIGGGLLDQAFEMVNALGDAIPDELTLATQAGKGAMGGKGRIWGMADVWSYERVEKEWQKYQDGLKSIYYQAIEDGWAQDRIDYEVEQYDKGHGEILSSYREMLAEQDRLAEQSAKDREKLLKDAVEGFRGMVEGALKPTDVTWEDVQATELGVYKDKWDEPARQMKAAMYDPASEFHDLIPADVWAAGPEAAQAYGQRWLDDFYAGMMPDAVNWPAFVEDFKRNLAQQAGRERLVDRAIEELEKQGITATSEDVLTALGLQSPFQQMFFGGIAPTAAGQQLQTSVETAMGQVSFTTETAEGPAKSFATVMTQGLTTELTQIDWGLKLRNAWLTSFTNNEQKIKNVGAAFWVLVYSGMMDAVDRSDLVLSIANKVLEMLNNEINEDAPPGGSRGGSARGGI
jgi:TP901 family phage tail tape measure protein